MSRPINNLPFVAGETVSDSRRDDESMLGIGEEALHRRRAHAAATQRTPTAIP